MNKTHDTNNLAAAQHSDPTKVYEFSGCDFRNECPFFRPVDTVTGEVNEYLYNDGTSAVIDGSCPDGSKEDGRRAETMKKIYLEPINDGAKVLRWKVVEAPNGTELEADITTAITIGDFISHLKVGDVINDELCAVLTQPDIWHPTFRIAAVR